MHKQWGIIPSIKDGTITETCPISFDEALFSVAGILANKVNPSKINAPVIYAYSTTPGNIDVTLDVYANEEVNSVLKANWFLICR